MVKKGKMYNLVISSVYFNATEAFGEHLNYRSPFYENWIWVPKFICEVKNIYVLLNRERLVIEFKPYHIVDFLAIMLVFLGQLMDLWAWFWIQEGFKLVDDKLLLPAEGYTANLLYVLFVLAELYNQVFAHE